MLENPHVTTSVATLTAVIPLTCPRNEIQHVMGPAIGELMGAIATQKIAPAGAIFSRHFKMDPQDFDFEVGVPVARPVTAAGRMQPGELGAKKIARAIYVGPYEGLGAAWGEFSQWIESEGLKPAPDLWERYLQGPESGNEPSQWRTELNRPLVG